MRSSPFRPAGFFLFLFVFFSAVALAAPTLNFSSPTGENGTYISRNWTEANISINESNLDTFWIDWNGTNYPIYDSSLVLALNFNNNSAIGENATKAVDASRYGNNGTLVGSPLWNESGRFGGGYMFDGSDDYVNLGNSSAILGVFDDNKNFSVELWFNPAEVPSAWQWLFSKAYASHDSPYYQFDIKYYATNTTNGNVFASVYDNSGNSSLSVASSAGSAPLNAWSHVAAVFDLGANTSKFYLNGALVFSTGSNRGTYVNYNTNITLGANINLPGSTTYNFNGSIDEVRIYNRSLTAQEIWLHYQSEFSKYDSSEYRFYVNVTNLSLGTYAYYGWANDTAGISAYTNMYDASNPRYLDVLLDTTAPILNFSAPTGDNASIIQWNWTEVNISISEQNLDVFRFHWNGSNYSIYDNSLVLAYNFNNNSVLGENATRIVDISRYGNNGTCDLASGYCPDYNSIGRFGGAYLFDGVHDYVDCGNSSSLDINSSITISAWIRLADGVTSSVVGRETWVRTMAFYKDTGNKIYFVYSTDGALENTQALISNSTVDGNWHHVAVAFDQGVWSLFIDGSVDNSGNSAKTSLNTNSNDNILIGYSGWAGGYANGTIDEVWIYNRSLSSQEVRMHYQMEFAKHNSTEYRFYANLTNLSSGTYTYYGWANDEAGNADMTGIRYLTSDRTAPQLVVSSPANATYTTSNISLNYTVSDDLNLSACWKYLNSTGLNETLPGCQHTTLNLTDGNYTIWVYANDSANNIAYAVAQFLVVTTSPSTTTTTTTTTSTTTSTTLPSFSVALLGPLNGTNVAGDSVSIIYRVGGTNGTYGCFAFFNGSLRSSNDSTQNDTNTSLSISGLIDGTWLWHVNCSVSDGWSNVSEVRVIDVVNTSSTTTTTTQAPHSHAPQTTSTTASSTTTSAIVSTTTTSSSASTTIRPDGNGDANGDGHVNYHDLVILAFSYSRSAGDEKYDLRADFNLDGVVDYLDFVILAQNYWR